MKRAAILVFVSIASIGASWAAFQALAPKGKLDEEQKLRSLFSLPPILAIAGRQRSVRCSGRPAAGHEFSHAGSRRPVRPRALRHRQTRVSLYYEIAFGKLDAIHTLADARKIRNTKRGKCDLLRSARSRIRA